MPNGQTGQNNSFLLGVTAPVANPAVQSPRCLEIQSARKTVRARDAAENSGCEKFRTVVTRV